MPRQYEDHWSWKVEFHYNKNVMHETPTPKQAVLIIPHLLGVFFSLIYELEHAGRLRSIVITKIGDNDAPFVSR